MEVCDPRSWETLDRFGGVLSAPFQWDVTLSHP